MTKTAVAGADFPVTWSEVEAFIRHYYMKAIEQDDEHRLGQAYFNGLAEIYPEVAELVRGTPADPFYANTLVDPRMVLFFETIVPYFK